MSGITRGKEALVLGVILLLALGLRVWGLAEEPAWYDEVITMAGTDLPTLEDFENSWAKTNWNAVPMYYTLQFFWAKAVSGSVVSFRLMGILFGMAAIGVLYALGRRLGGWQAGAIAAACMALSYVHIYQAQEVRNYSMTTLAAVLTAYTFVRVIQGGDWRWWVANVAANLFLVWTHLFGCFLLVACGLAWLAVMRRRWRAAFLWGGLNLTLMIPSVLWIQGFEDIQYYQPPIPPLWMMVNNMMTDVWSPTFNLFFPEGEAWQFERSGLGAFLASNFQRVDLLLLVLLAGLAAAGAWMLTRRDAESEPNRYGTAAFIVLWLVMPAVVLWTLAQLWRSDILSPKYTTYSSLAVYVLAGMAIASVRWRWAKGVLVVLLLGGFAHHFAVAKTHPQRPPWYAAVEPIHADADAESAAFLIYPEWQKITLEYNLRPLTPEIGQTFSLEDVCTKTEARLADGDKVWFVWVGGYGNRAFLEHYESFLELRGHGYEAHAFWGGMKVLFTYRVEAGGRLLEGEALDAVIQQAVEGHAIAADGTTEAIPIEE